MTRAGTPGAEARFDDLVGSLNAIVWEADGDDYHMTFVSPRSVEITGYSPDQWMTQPAFWESRLHPDDRERAIAETEAAIGAMRNVSLEYRFKVRSGDFRWFSDVIRVVPKRDGSGHRLVGVMIDISSQKRLEEELAFRASHDPLTGLLNREQLDSELARVRVLDEPWALLFLDLDGFKDVNDGLGHAVGDEVLRVVARRIRHSAREGDVVARFGGDEFAVLAAAPDRETAEALATRLREQIRLPVAAGDHILSIDASVGIALVDPRAPIGTVMRKADAAMYWAKKVDGHVAAFEEWMQEQALRRLDARSSGRGPRGAGTGLVTAGYRDRAGASRSA
jgi:diguanylate cyclase (GGDEF)-like protein/PAS domain S-box-containing protein